MSVYDRVKECCKEEGISIRHLEIALNLGNGTIKHWVNNNPTLMSIAAVADYFEKPVDYFVGEKD